MINDDTQSEEDGSDEVQHGLVRARRRIPSACRGSLFAGVVVNRPIEQVLTYRAPARLAQSLRPGQRVRVPLGKGNRLTTGYCVSVDSAPPEGLDPQKLKEVVEVLDLVPLIDAKMLELTRWIGRVLRLLVGPGPRCGGAGGSPEPGRHPGRHVSVGSRGNAPGG